LFDAVASLAGVRQVVNYEAQAAIELEALAHGGEYGVYPFEVRPGNGAGLIDPLPMIHAIVDDLRQRQPVSCIAARFHNTLVMLVDRLCHQLRQQSGLSQVVLSGGVWQNRTLLQRVAAMLKNDNFDVLIHQRIPANDGGLAVGQVAIAAHRFNAFINEST
jgi:hydrogenase maturation protein HypF